MRKLSFALQASRRDASLSIGRPSDHVSGILGAIRENVRDKIAFCYHRCAAAILYAELSGLSDAELERRGIARGDLHRVVSEIRDARANGDYVKR